MTSTVRGSLGRMTKNHTRFCSTGRWPFREGVQGGPTRTHSFPQPEFSWRRQHFCKRRCEKHRKSLSKSYREGLLVFVVGEEATHGIHRGQFRNALAWISALTPDNAERRLGILGPTFSGSLPSLTQVFAENKSDGSAPVLADRPANKRLAIYSGNVTGHDSAAAFQKDLAAKVIFRSFLQDDDTTLQQFCNYMKDQQPDFKEWKVAVISEDETAYGGHGFSNQGDKDEKPEQCSAKTLNLVYPRDISALRRGLPDEIDVRFRANATTRRCAKKKSSHGSCRSRWEGPRFDSLLRRETRRRSTKRRYC